MSYLYQEVKPKLFTEDGSVMFTNIRDHVVRLLKRAGAVRMHEAMQAAKSGDSWTMIACVDRLVELGELREIKQQDVCGQDRVFVRGKP